MTTFYKVCVVDGSNADPIKTGDQAGSLRALSKVFHKAAGRLNPQALTIDCRDGAARATGTLTLSTASGTVGGIINGVTITATWATSDANSAGLIAAAINASSNALVQNIVTASASGAVVTVTAVEPGVSGNCVTLAASGTGVTASGARLTGGAETFARYSL